MSSCVVFKLLYQWINGRSSIKSIVEGVREGWLSHLQITNERKINMLMSVGNLQPEQILGK